MAGQDWRVSSYSNGGEAIRVAARWARGSRSASNV